MTDGMRMHLAAVINREGVPDSYDGPLWDTEGLKSEFEVLGFAAPYVVVRRRSDGEKGSLMFVHSPRVYFDYQPS